MPQQLHVLFFGTPEFAVPSLEQLSAHNDITVSLVVTQPDSPKGRSKMPQQTDIKRAAIRLSIPVITPHSLKHDEELIKKYGPFDVGVVVAYGKILPDWILSLPKKGTLNVHPSKLPDLRGPSPIQTALLYGEKETAVSYIHLDSEMDHGPIVKQIPVPIDEIDTYQTLSEKLARTAGEELPDVTLGYITGTYVPKDQNHEQATFSKMLQKDDGKLNWNSTVQEVFNAIRALNPWPGTYTYWGDKKLKILEAKPYARERDTTPGLVQKGHNALIVETANGSIEVLRLQLEGKKSLSPQDFLNGHPDIEGSHLS